MGLEMLEDSFSGGGSPEEPKKVPVQVYFRGDSLHPASEMSDHLDRPNRQEGIRLILSRIDNGSLIAEEFQYPTDHYIGQSSPIEIQQTTDRLVREFLSASFPDLCDRIRDGYTITAEEIAQAYREHYGFMGFRLTFSPTRFVLFEHNIYNVAGLRVIDGFHFRKECLNTASHKFQQLIASALGGSK